MFHERFFGESIACVGDLLANGVSKVRVECDACDQESLIDGAALNPDISLDHALARVTCPACAMPFLQMRGLVAGHAT